MGRLFILFTLVCCQFGVMGQPATEWQNRGKKYLIEGDYVAAISNLQSALAQDSSDLSVIKDLALAYNFQDEFAKTIQLFKPLIDSGKMDDQCVQLAGNAFKSLHQYDAFETLYKKALKDYPENGILYNELAELLWSLKDMNCITYWEKGIQNDPNYANNYYNACLFYNQKNEKIWPLIYGEIFVNLDPSGKKTPEMKEMLLNNYRQLFSQSALNSLAPSNNTFIQKFLGTIYKQHNVIADTVTTSTLTMLRTRFILDWFYDPTDAMPFYLFEYHKQLLEIGLFEAYNQWLFGSTEDLIKFQNWAQLHNTEYKAFVQFQQSKLFKITKRN